MMNRLAILALGAALVSWSEARKITSNVDNLRVARNLKDTTCQCPTRRLGGQSITKPKKKQNCKSYILLNCPTAGPTPLPTHRPTHKPTHQPTPSPTPSPIAVKSKPTRTVTSSPHTSVQSKPTSFATKSPGSSIVSKPTTSAPTPAPTPAPIPSAAIPSSKPKPAPKPKPKPKPKPAPKPKVAPVPKAKALSTKKAPPSPPMPQKPQSVSTSAPKPSSASTRAPTGVAPSSQHRSFVPTSSSSSITGVTKTKAGSGTVISQSPVAVITKANTKIVSAAPTVVTRSPRTAPTVKINANNFAVKSSASAASSDAKPMSSSIWLVIAAVVCLCALVAIVVAKKRSDHQAVDASHPLSGVVANKPGLMSRVTGKSNNNNDVGLPSHSADGGDADTSYVRAS